MSCTHPPEYRIASLTSQIDGREYVLVVALVGDQIAGTVRVWNSDETSRIFDLFVKDGFRRQGIAITLLQECAAIAREQKQRAISLHVSHSNAAAIQLYEKCGWTIADKDETYYFMTMPLPRSMGESQNSEG